MEYAKNTSAIARSCRSMEALTSDGDTLAMLAKLVRQELYSEQLGAFPKHLVRGVITDMLAMTSRARVDFSDISFRTVDTKSPKDFFLYNTDPSTGASEPHLEVHFWPIGGCRLDSIKQSMGEASQWLADVAGEYPVVQGCTYKELAGVALKHFGFEDIVGEGELAISENYKCRIALSHKVFSLMNGIENQPPELVGIVARAEHLAEQWSKYKE